MRFYLMIRFPGMDFCSILDTLKKLFPDLIAAHAHTHEGWSRNKSCRRLVLFERIPECTIIRFPLAKRVPARSFQPACAIAP
jgi:hypothetical protein